MNSSGFVVPPTMLLSNISPSPQHSGGSWKTHIQSLHQQQAQPWSVSQPGFSAIGAPHSSVAIETRNAQFVTPPVQAAQIHAARPILRPTSVTLSDAQGQYYQPFASPPVSIIGQQAGQIRSEVLPATVSPTVQAHLAAGFLPLRQQQQQSFGQPMPTMLQAGIRPNAMSSEVARLATAPGTGIATSSMYAYAPQQHSGLPSFSAQPSTIQSALQPITTHFQMSGKNTPQMPVYTAVRPNAQSAGSAALSPTQLSAAQQLPWQYSLPQAQDGAQPQSAAQVGDVPVLQAPARSGELEHAVTHVQQQQQQNSTTRPQGLSQISHETRQVGQAEQQMEQYMVTKIRAVTDAPKDYIPGVSAVDYIVAPSVPPLAGQRKVDLEVEKHEIPLHGQRAIPLGAQSEQQQAAPVVAVEPVSQAATRVQQMEVPIQIQQQQFPLFQTAEGMQFLPQSMAAAGSEQPASEAGGAATEDANAFEPIKVGAKLPPAHIDLHGVCVNLQEFFEDRSGIIFGLVGAFHPVDSDECVPRILNCMEHFEKLVDFVGCLVTNDPFVVKAWAKKLGVTDQFTFIADSDAKFTKVLGMAQSLPQEGLGLRTRRFVAVIGPRARIRWIAFDEEAYADHVLTQLPRFVRTPWKSFLASVGYTKALRNSQDTVEFEAEQQVKSNTVNTLQNVRALLQQQGFCADSDWQLLLCDKISDVYMPTKDNLLNGLKWLVEGAQAGDVLCFYFAGAGKTYTDGSGRETVGLLPLDHETAGAIDQWEIFDVLAPHVPPNCRLTVILDVHSDTAATMPLPYSYRSEVGSIDGQQFEARIIPSQTVDEPRFQDLRGEVLVITLTGFGEVPFGSISTLLTAVCTRPIDETTAAAGNLIDSNTPVISAESMPTGLPPLSYAAQLERMQMSLLHWGNDRKNVEISSSKPLDLAEEFSLADVLPVAAD